MSLEDFDFKEGFTVDGKHKIVMLDYPNYKPKFYTDQEMKILDDCRDRMAKIIKEHNVHIIINDHVYIKVKKNGVFIDKSLRIKVDSDLYNKIMINGQLPQWIEENDEFSQYYTK